MRKASRSTIRSSWPSWTPRWRKWSAGRSEDRWKRSSRNFARGSDVKVVTSGRAERQITRALAWWQQHRDKAPQALEEELQRLKALLAQSPYAGEVVRGTRRRGARRLRLDRVRYHV